MSMFTLYLLFVIMPNLHDTVGMRSFLALIGTMALIVYIVSRIGVATSRKDSDDMALSISGISVSKIIMTTCFSLFLLFYFIGIVTPDEDQVYKIAGGYIVTNDAELKKLPDNVFKVANDYLEKIQKKNETNKTEEK